MAFTDPKSTISIETVLMADDNVVTTTSEVRGRFYTETYEGFYFRGQETDGIASYEFRFYDAEIGGNLVGSHFFINSPTKTVEVSMPVLGPYLEITFRAQGGVQIDTFWTGAVCNWTGVLGEDAFDNLLIRQDAVNVNAGATLTRNNVGSIWPGNAKFQFITPSTTYNATLEYQFYDGTWLVFNRWTNTGSGVVHQVNLPATPVRAQFVNNGAAATTAGLFLSTNLIIGN
jgi:hypothetical protein